MMIEPMGMNGRGRGRIYLETATGLPAFEVVGNLQGFDLGILRDAVDANRATIEAAWLRTMADKGWLHVAWDGGLQQPIRIVAYSGTSNKRVHPLTIRWRDIIGDRIPVSNDVAMDRANGILILGAQEPTPVHVPLAEVLWAPGGSQA